MTHRTFSRNASSSRAIPVERLIKDVVDDPVYPTHWGKNQPGMQADEEHDERIRTFDGVPSGGSTWSRKEAWDMARMDAVAMAKAFSKAGYHKQIVNRLLEPFCHINVVVTATEWSNFFALRCHPGAQPEMRILAEAMRDAMAGSQPEHILLGHWHTPYVDQSVDRFDWSDPDDAQRAVKISVARCARVSYLTQEGATPTIGADLKLYDRLVGAVPLHASPAEHQATPDTLRAPRIDEMDEYHWDEPHLHGNFKGWVQFRKTLPGECQ